MKFCGQCKSKVSDCRGFDYCKLNPTVKKNYDRCFDSHYYCRDKNKNNDCSEFEPNLRTKLFGGYTECEIKEMS